MHDGNFENVSSTTESSSSCYTSDLLQKIDCAYRICKLCEVFLNDVSDDYGKLKIAKLRLEFARHELSILLKEANEKGVKYDNPEMIKRFFNPETNEKYLYTKEKYIEGGK